MQVTAEFTYTLLPPNGVPIDPLRTHLGDLVIVINGTQIVVKPLIEEMAFDEPVLDENGHEIGERPYRYHALHALKAVIRREVDSVQPRVFDRPRFEQLALQCLHSAAQPERVG